MAGKLDVAEHVARSVDGLTKKQATEALNAVFDAVTEYLTNGDRVQISGFGSFSVSERAARTGRNPATGESIQIPATKVARFKAAKDLKAALND